MLGDANVKLNGSCVQERGQRVAHVLNLLSIGACLLEAREQHTCQCSRVDKCVALCVAAPPSPLNQNTSLMAHLPCNV